MNLSKVANGLFRGSRPECKADLNQLAISYGVQTIISLETGFGAFWSRFLGKPFDESGWWSSWFARKFITHSLSNFFPPSKCETYKILSDILSAQRAGAVFIHCYAGVDRTGWVVAAWRVAQDGIAPEAAWEEAVRMGLHARFFWWSPHFMEMFAHD